MKVKSPSRDDVAIDMSPMIDMVFLLLIFFIVASVVADPAKVEVDVPESSYAKVPEDIKDRMILSVDANNQVYDGAAPVTMNELKVRISEELDLNPNLRVLIRADHRVLYETLKKIMIACGEVGATDLIYATFEE
ncbi:MAG TPA: biopolymer transporter ExbD [Pontiella sp.]